MFTGLIESLGKVVSIRRSAAGARLSIDLGPSAGDVKPGGSVAVNGVCLSAAGACGAILEFDVVYETLSRTNLGLLAVAQWVNIELPLRLSDRIEGHFVQGHVDTTGRIARWQDQGTSKLLTIEPEDNEFLKYLVPKGSVAVDGVSLTIARVDDPEFSIALIPTTLEKTILNEKPIGQIVNLEADILVKTIVRQMSSALGAKDSHFQQTLKHSGFMP